MVPQQPRPQETWFQKSTSYLKKKFSGRHFRNQKQLVFFLAAIVIINASLFIARAYYFRGFSNLDGSFPNPFYMMSRANGTSSSLLQLSRSQIEAIAPVEQNQSCIA